MSDTLDLENRIRLKSMLLSLGCTVGEGVRFPESISLKAIHLYAHSTQESQVPIPEDVILRGSGGPIIARVRYAPHSKLRLCQRGESYVIEDVSTGQTCPIDFVRRSGFYNYNFGEDTVSSVCSYLGADVLGVTPSNYCFYYGTGQQCRFCEILPTYLSKVEYKKALKLPPVIGRAISTALRLEDSIRHIAVTSGNVQSYDYTSTLFAQIGQQLTSELRPGRVEQILATIMPPDDFRLIAELKRSGYNKIYFPLEIFRKDLFKVVCPGKYEYGYDRMLEALGCALEAFGPGNVYTNFIYGIQSLNCDLDSASFDPEVENRVGIEAVEFMLEMRVIPAFTFYHYGGFNSIGRLTLPPDDAFSFFKRWGELVHSSGLVPAGSDAVLFGPRSLSNTLFNDGFLLAKDRSLSACVR